jgi:hypothetical protein
LYDKVYIFLCVFEGFGGVKKRARKVCFFVKICRNFVFPGSVFGPVFGVPGVVRGSPKSGKIVKNGKNRGFGDGLDLSLEALFDAKTPILLGFWGWPF